MNRPQNRTPIEARLGSREAAIEWMKAHTKRQCMQEFKVTHETAKRWMQKYETLYHPQCNRCGCTDLKYMRLDTTGKLNQGLCELCKKMPRKNLSDERIKNPKLTYEFDIVDPWVFAEVKKPWGNGGDYSYYVQGLDHVASITEDYS